MRQPGEDQGPAGVGAWKLFAVLGALTAFGPLATDLYLPALPDMARMLSTSPSLAQLTISTCLVGLALGQLVAGPLSDRLGRRRPLLVGVAMFAVTSVLCAVATSIWALLGLRLLQGLAGGAGIVIARAIVRDLYSGRRAARVFSHLMLVFGLAPVVAPLIGGQILLFADWRGLFVALSLIGLVLLAGSWFGVRETLPAARRHSAGLPAQLRQLRALATDSSFTGYMAIAGLHGATLFTYISMSSFVLRDDHGISSQEFSVVFAVNAVGLVLGAQLNGALVMRVGPARLLRGALVLIVLSSAALLVGSLSDGGLAAVLVPLFLVVSCMGGIGANNTALALTPHPAAAGSAAALLGMSSFGVGAVVPPLASVLGTHGWVMGATMLLTSVLGLAVLLLVVRPDEGPEPAIVADLA